MYTLKFEKYYNKKEQTRNYNIYLKYLNNYKKIIDLSNRINNNKEIQLTITHINKLFNEFEKGDYPNKYYKSTHDLYILALKLRDKLKNKLQDKNIECSNFKEKLIYKSLEDIYFILQDIKSLKITKLNNIDVSNIKLNNLSKEKLIETLQNINNIV